MANPAFVASGSSSFDELTERAAALADADEQMLYELIQARESAGLTQRALADILGISQPAVSKFERHGSDPRLSTVRKYALSVGAHVRHEVVPAAHHGQIVDPTLMEQVGRLSEAELVEFRDAIEARLGDDVPAGQWVVLEQRIAEADADPDDYITLDEWKARRRARRPA